jgi:hypothetical protein
MSLTADQRDRASRALTGMRFEHQRLEVDYVPREVVVVTGGSPWACRAAADALVEVGDAWRDANDHLVEITLRLADLEEGRTEERLTWEQTLAARYRALDAVSELVEAFALIDPSSSTLRAIQEVLEAEHRSRPPG